MRRDPVFDEHERPSEPHYYSVSSCYKGPGCPLKAGCQQFSYCDGVPPSCPLRTGPAIVQLENQ